jgi:hypothetical protein
MQTEPTSQRVLPEDRPPDLAMMAELAEPEVPELLLKLEGKSREMDNEWVRQPFRLALMPCSCLPALSQRV